MKDYFIRLLKYDQYANQIVLKAIREANDPVKAVQLMAHLLAAQQVWLSRFKEEPLTGVILWPDDSKADTFEQLINDNSTRLLQYLDTVAPDDLEKDINYKNLQGVPYQNRSSDILAHLINHGTHHRAQIGQQLKFAGAKDLPNTDYINFVRK